MADPSPIFGLSLGSNNPQITQGTPLANTYQMLQQLLLRNASMNAGSVNPLGSMWSNRGQAWAPQQPNLERVDALAKSLMANYRKPTAQGTWTLPPDSSYRPPPLGPLPPVSGGTPPPPPAAGPPNNEGFGPLPPSGGTQPDQLYVPSNTAAVDFANPRHATLAWAKGGVSPEKVGQLFQGTVHDVRGRAITGERAQQILSGGGVVLLGDSYYGLQNVGGSVQLVRVPPESQMT